MSSRPALISPHDEPERRTTRRPVWRTALREIALIVIGTLLVLLIARFLPSSLGTSQQFALSVILALAPLGLWFAISYRGERRALEPRQGLITVLIVTLLAASGIGVPLVERLFAVDDWLSTTSGLQRILGYALTAGFIQEFIKFAAIRFTVWPEQFKVRIDGIAYSFAASIGYATVLSLTYVLATPAVPPLPSAVALRVAGFTLSQLAIGTISGYTLAELKLGRPAVFWVPLGLLLAAFMEGLYVTLRAGVIVSGFSATSTGSTLAAGLAVSLFFVLIMFGSVSFLINNADARDKRSPEFVR